jgi:hypothetical protein
MPLIALNLQDRPPLYPRMPLQPRPFALKSANLSRAVWPFRGLAGSILVHELAVLTVFFSPLFEALRQPPLLSPDQVFVIDMNSPSKLVYFPSVRVREESEERTSPERPEDQSEQPAKTRTLRTQGLSYPGRQRMVADVPKPTNQFQTLLQPGLVNPPVIQPTPLPNIIQLADAGPLPLPLPPKPELTTVKKDLAIPAPATTLLQRPNVVLPSAAAPAPAPAEPVQPPTAVRPELTVPAPTIASAQRPKVVLPLAAEPVLPVPEKPIELTVVHRDLAIPSPSQVAPAPRAIAGLPAANSTSAPLDRPMQPATQVRKDLTILSPSQVATAQKTNVTVPVPGTGTAIAPPAQVAPVETQGPDRLNLLSITPLPAPPQASIKVPAGEARGRFAITPDPDLNASAATPGAKTDNPPTTSAGVGRDRADAPGRGNAPASGANGNDRPDADGAPAAGDGAAAGTGRGNGPGGAPARSPFSGITIQGGRLEGTGVVNSTSRTGTTTLPGSPPKPAQTSYGITVVSAAGSGGGLPDLGVFVKEQVYTVYLDMRHRNGAPAPPWTLQYALSPPVVNPSGLVPPFPMVKLAPDFPTELAQKYVRRLVIVYATIDTEGKLKDVAVKQTPDAKLDPFVLAALSNWSFRPAQVNGAATSVKILLGVPIALP